MERIEEQLASFYLGQQFDLAEGRVLEQAVYYDARDLTTHAVCLGMTGSGKTGLGIILLEEAALDGVPALVIDPKGDMTNLLLTFPDLRPEDFRPWVNPDDARRKDMDLDTYAAKTAELWREGLARSGQGPDRIRRLKDSADFAIYTPGSSAGRQVSILSTFRAPTLSWETESELLRDKIESVVSALLGLVGIQADPVRSREQILLANIFESAWRAGQDLDLAELILRVQKPPFSQLGVFPVDTFFPEKDRMGLAMLLNGLVASPSFASWTQGDSLDVDGLLRGPSGKPQVCIFYIAHLSDAERQFFITLLLEQVVSWVRAQSGTTSLRALLYMDELFGYLPPHPENPPTKKPLLTLLKQARAFGLGLILVTQNPVDLDYKALSNAGTWLIGRMQAARDKQRLLDGLEGVQVSDNVLGRAELDRLISAVQSRVFLLHNVHQNQPVVFQTRWALSYLCGPLTRPQVQQLVTEETPPPAPAIAQSTGVVLPSIEAVLPPAKLTFSPPAPASSKAPVSYSQTPPPLPSSVAQVFLPVQISQQAVLAELARNRGGVVQPESGWEATLIYEPALVGTARLYFAHAPSRQTHTEEVAYLGPMEGGVVDWAHSRVHLETSDLTTAPMPGARFAELPPELGDVKRHVALRKEFDDHLGYTSSVSLWYNPHLKLYSEIGESDKAFQRRCRRAAEEARDAEAQKLKNRYEREWKQLESKLRREEQELDKDRIRYDARKGEKFRAMVGLALKGKLSRRIAAARTKSRQARQAKAEVQESKQTIDELETQIAILREQAKRELEELDAQWNQWMDEVEEIKVRPRRSDVHVHLFALAWIPYWEMTVGEQTISMAAFEAEPA